MCSDNYVVLKYIIPCTVIYGLILSPHQFEEYGNVGIACKQAPKWSGALKKIGKQYEPSVAWGRKN